MIEAKPKDKLKLPFYPALDGLRAVAVIGVIAYHIRLKPFSGGFLGVDLFFSISGYLITLLLLLEFYSSGSISLKQFYIRRVRRIFPALVFFLIVFLLTCYLQGRAMKRPLIDAGVSFLNIANWTRALGYGVPRTLGHLWSLSLEVQFYLLWAPLCILALKLWRTRWAVSALCVLVAIGAYFFRVAVLENKLGGGMIYNALFSRLDAFMIGALLATLMVGRSGVVQKLHTPQFRWFVTLCGIVAVVAQYQLMTGLSLSRWTRNPEIPFLVSIPAFFLVLAATGIGGSYFPRPFAWAPVQYLGKISYGLYLWHYPIIHLFRFRGVSTEGRFLIVVTLSTICASISYYLIERRFLRKSKSYAAREHHSATKSNPSSPFEPPRPVDSHASEHIVIENETRPRSVVNVS